MKVSIGKKGLKKTWQADFPKTTKCVHCDGEARIGFVAHEGIEEEVVYPRDYTLFICDIYKNKEEKNLWLHDCCAVAIYFCKKCLEPTALYNQA